MLEADDLERGGPGERGRLGGGEQRLGRVPGVDAQGVKPGRGEEPPVNFRSAKVPAPRLVLRERRVRRQVEQRRAPPPECQPGQRVEGGPAGRGATVTFIEEFL